MQITDRKVLASLMEARELSRTELGELAGVSRQLIGHLLTGERSTCSPTSAERISRALFVPLTVLFVPKTSADSGQTDKGGRTRRAAA